MPEQREDSSQCYEHSVTGETRAEPFNSLFRQPHPLLHHPANSNETPENLPWELSVGACGLCPCGTGITVVQ